LVTPEENTMMSAASADVISITSKAANNVRRTQAPLQLISHIPRASAARQFGLCIIRRDFRILQLHCRFAKDALLRPATLADTGDISSHSNHASLKMQVVIESDDTGPLTQ
jgi:HEAT repeat protein